MKQIIKRDGTKVDFNKQKINNAIKKAMKYGSGIYKPDLAKLISKDADNFFKDGASIYDIEKFVFDRLVMYGQSETARYYEQYRAIQSFKRQNNTTDNAIISLVSNENEEVMNENSNKNAVIASTQRDLIAGEVSKDIARRKLLPAHIVQAHNEGILWIHDMDYLIQPIFNCSLINLEDMLQNGTVINEKMVESPKSFGTACTIATQVIAGVAGSQYGLN